LNSQSLGTLIVKKFDNWKQTVETFNKDSSHEHHIKCSFDANNLSNMLRNHAPSINWKHLQTEFLN
jgi:hypothetical protein